MTFEIGQRVTTDGFFDDDGILAVGTIQVVERYTCLIRFDVGGCWWCNKELVAPAIENKRQTWTVWNQAKTEGVTFSNKDDATQTFIRGDYAPAIGYLFMAQWPNDLFTMERN